MTEASNERQSRLGAWVRWLLFFQSLVLLLAVAGPGYRYAVHDKGDHALIARWVMDEPGFLDAVVVNFIVVNAFIICIWIAAWLVTKLKRN